MSVTYCIDHFASSELPAPETTIHGWIVAPFPLQKIILLCPKKGCLTIEINQAREDVEEVFSQVPYAKGSGFNLTLPIAIDASEPIEAILQGETQSCAPRDLITHLDFSVSIPQTLLEEDGSYKALPLEEKVHRVLEAKPSITLRLDIINKCNLRCMMCHYSDDEYFKRKAKRISLEEFQDFFDSIAPMVKDIMLSCSDEPLLSPHFLTIVEHITTQYPHVEMEFCTNAMLLNESNRRGIVKHGITYLMCSLDAATKATLESIRIGSNFEKIVANILALKILKDKSETQFPKVISNFVMMEQNIHEAPIFVEMCSQLGVDEIDFRHVVPGKYWNDPEQFLQNNPAKFNYYREQILEKSQSTGVEIHIPEALETEETYLATDPAVTLDDFNSVTADEASDPSPVEPKQFQENFVPRNIHATAVEIFGDTYCPRPFSEICIFDQEIIRPCPFHKVALGNQSEGNSLKEVFFGERFKEVRRNMYKPSGDPNCRGCPVKGNYFGERVQLEH